MTCSAVILAGGKSSRMKRNKALITIKGKTFIELIGQELEKKFNEILVITNTPEEYEFLPYKIYKDLFPHKGPLGGIHAGLKYSTNYYSFFTACDMPFIDSNLAKTLCEMTKGYDGVVPKKGSYLQPLFAVYSKACIPYIEKSLSENKLKIISFYKFVNILYPSWDKLILSSFAERTFFNVNTPEDLKFLENQDKK